MFFVHALLLLVGGLAGYHSKATSSTNRRYVKLLLIFEILLSTVYCTYEENEETNIHITNGIYYQPLSTVKIYSSSTPLIFQIPIPNDIIDIPIIPLLEYENGTSESSEADISQSPQAAETKPQPLGLVVHPVLNSTDNCSTDANWCMLMSENITQFLTPLLLEQNISISGYSTCQVPTIQSEFYICLNYLVQYVVNVASFIHTAMTYILQNTTDEQEKHKQTLALLMLFPTQLTEKYSSLYNRSKRSIDNDAPLSRVEFDLNDDTFIGCQGHVTNASLYPYLERLLTSRDKPNLFNHVVSNGTHLYICSFNVVLYTISEPAALQAVLELENIRIHYMTFTQQIQELNNILQSFPHGIEIAFLQRISRTNKRIRAKFGNTDVWTSLMQLYRKHEPVPHVHFKTITTHDMHANYNLNAPMDTSDMSGWRNYFFTTWLKENDYPTNYTGYISNSTHFTFSFDHPLISSSNYILEVSRSQIEKFIISHVFPLTIGKQYHIMAQTTQLMKFLRREFPMFFTYHESGHSEELITQCIRLYFRKQGLSIPHYDYTVHNATHLTLVSFTPNQSPVYNYIYRADIFSLAINALLMSNVDPHPQNPVFTMMLLDILNEFPEFDRSRIEYSKYMQSPAVFDVMSHFNIETWIYDVVQIINSTHANFYKYFPYQYQSFDYKNDSYFFYLLQGLNATDISPIDAPRTVFVFYTFPSYESRSHSLVQQVNAIYPANVLNHYLALHGLKCKYATASNYIYHVICEYNNRSQIVHFSRAAVFEFFTKQTTPAVHSNHSQFDTCLMETFSTPPGFTSAVHWQDLTFEEQRQLVKFYNNNEIPFFSHQWYSTSFPIENETHPLHPFLPLFNTTTIHDRFYRYNINLTTLIDANSSTSLAEIPLTRMKRGLGHWIGEQWSSCCSLVLQDQIQSVQDNAQAMQLYLETLKTTLSNEHSSLIQIQTDLRNVHQFYDERVRSIRNDLLSIFTEVDKNRHNTVEIYNVLHHYSKIIRETVVKQHIIATDLVKSYCNNHILSPTIISETDLLSALTNLTERMSTFTDTRFQLLFPISSLELYYQYPIMFCHYSPDTITIKLNIPLTNTNTNYVVHRLHTLPFQIRLGEVCHYQSLPDYVMIDVLSKQLRLIEPHSYSECTSEKAHNLCMLNQYSNTYHETFPCLHHLLFESQHSLLDNVCNHVCNNYTFPLIYQLAPMEFVITNVAEIEISCINTEIKTLPNIVTHHRLHDVGSLRLKLPCNCHVTHKGEVIVNPVFPCPTTSMLDVIQIVPSTFLNFSQFQYFGDNIRISTTDVKTFLKRKLLNMPQLTLHGLVDNITNEIQYLKTTTVPRLFNIDYVPTTESYFFAIVFLTVALIVNYYLLIFKVLYKRQKLLESSHEREEQTVPTVNRFSRFWTRRPQIVVRAEELQNMLQINQANTNQVPPLYPTL
jgi:hypothetical protein